MSLPHRQAARIAGPLLCGIAFYVAAASALALTRGQNGTAAFWPANGVLLAALLVAPRQDRWRYIAAVVPASVAANMQIGVGLLAALGFTAGNIGEALLALRLAGSRRRALPSFAEVHDVARFFLAAFVAAVASASLATPFDAGDPLAAWSSWVTTDLLGMLIVTPTIVSGVTYVRERGVAALVGAAPLLVGVAAMAALAFGQSTYPLFFLSLAALLIAMLRLGPFGAAASTLIVASIGSGCTFAGLGPLASGARLPMPHPILFLQFYLLVLLATSLPLAAMLAARDQVVRRLAESNRMLHLAERGAGVGHWWIAASGIGNHCSPEVLRIHGHDRYPAGGLATFQQDYDPDDRERIVALIDQALRDGTPLEYEARLVTAAGVERRVRSRGQVDRSPDGTVLGLFGTLQDVTEQVAGQRALEKAALEAGEAARLATYAAETDALTGVANRRKVARLLADAITAAADDGRPLSVAMLDLDHFKAINDGHGHLVGDQVLARVARVAAASLRGDDVVGRIGGEEFVLLLPSADIDQASAIANRVREAIADGDDLAVLPPVTASIGIATLRPGEDAQTLLHRADGALYAAKHAGRNALRHAA